MDFERDPAALQAAMLARVQRRVVASGSLSLPAAPALAHLYAEALCAQFRMVGRAFSAEEAAALEKNLHARLAEAFQASPFSRVSVTWETDPPPEGTLSYTIVAQPSTMEEQYEEWTRSREPPLFGAHADAKVLDLARGLGPPAQVRVLDVGAGTGRNALPLAKLGHPVTALETAPALLEILRKARAAEAPALEVLEGNLLDPALALPARAFTLVVMSEVVSHLRSVEELRQVLQMLSGALAPGGLLLCNAFLAKQDWVPDPLARELSEVFWSSVFTRAAFEEAAAAAGLSLDSDEQAFAYEREHLPAEAWPPTGWFADWTRGLDLFALDDERAPMELRWLSWRKA
ncbi:MAG: class I SAM-dependent methyltransferase [Deltaproteobacteria bacterium]|nr:class I SAM-dependent methyltransferase [Deltaproteobacteria bacterium]